MSNSRTPDTPHLISRIRIVLKKGRCPPSDTLFYSSLDDIESVCINGDIDVDIDIAPVSYTMHPISTPPCYSLLEGGSLLLVYTLPGCQYASSRLRPLKDPWFIDTGTAQLLATAWRCF